MEERNQLLSCMRIGSFYKKPDGERLRLVPEKAMFAVSRMDMFSVADDRGVGDQQCCAPTWQIVHEAM